MPAATQIPESIATQICEQYKSGAPISALVKLFIFGEKPITRLLVKAGLHTMTPRQFYVLEGKSVELLKRYSEGESMADLAKSYNVTLKVMSRFLKNNGVVTRLTTSNLGDNEQQLIADYLRGESPASLAKKYRVCVTNTVRRILKENAIEIRPSTQHVKAKRLFQFSKYTRNEAVLDDIDSEEKAYFMGFFYADGYNNQRHGRTHIGIEIQAKDEAILHRFNTLFDSNRPLIKYEKRNSVTFWIHSKQLSDRMAELGCPQKKSFILTYPEWLKPELVRHFIRGYIDGDGCIYAKGKQKTITVVGSIAFNTQLMDVLREACQVNSSIRPVGDKGICTAYIYGGIQVSRVLDYLYTDSTIHLDRKKAKAELILKALA